MEDILKYIPGFRTDKKWKRAIAMIYYIFCLLMLLGGVGVFLILISFPFILFSILGIIKHKDKISIATFIIAIIICGIGGNLLGDVDTNKTVNTTKEIVVAETTPKIEEKSTERTKKESDKKANNISSKHYQIFQEFAQKNTLLFSLSESEIEVETWTRKDNWQSGCRYSFKFKNHDDKSFLIYFKGDSINAIFTNNSGSEREEIYRSE